MKNTKPQQTVLQSENIETNAMKAILEGSEEIILHGRTFLAPPPTLATLIRVSREISSFPQSEMQNEDILKLVLLNAQSCKKVGLILALLIRGDKEAGKGWFSLTSLIHERKILRLARWINNHITPEEALQVLTERLQKISAVDFFAITTFLNEINLLKTTREVVA